MSGHQNCKCDNYKPDRIGDAKKRLDGRNYYCGTCGKFVDTEKWTGSFVLTRPSHSKKLKRVWRDKTHCPCCGIKLRLNRRKSRSKPKSVIVDVAVVN